jgi:hypothetical protein
MGKVTHENYPQFREKYEEAVREEVDTFEFEGQQVLTSYAKYVVEYVEKGGGQ